MQTNNSNQSNRGAKFGKVALVVGVALYVLYVMTTTILVATRQGSGVVARVERHRTAWVVFESGKRLDIPMLVSRRVQPGDRVEKTRGSLVYRVGNDRINTLRECVTSGLVFFVFGVFAYVALVHVPRWVAGRGRAA